MWNDLQDVLEVCVGHCAGVKIRGEKIYMNAHICMDDFVRGEKLTVVAFGGGKLEAWK